VNLKPSLYLRPLLRWLLAAAVLAAPAAVQAKGEPTELLGEWVLNSELTHELQPEQSGGGGGGFGTPTISIGGVGVPLPRGSSNAGGSGGARDPRVLRCNAMTVTMSEEDVHFAYQGAGEETMVSGNDHGRKTSWSRDRLTQKYNTNVRSVRKSYELDDEGRLIVKVKINPKGSKSATHVRVFERPAAVPAN
jgi:hypothetical protein